jgi:hypothetical protein
MVPATQMSHLLQNCNIPTIAQENQDMPDVPTDPQEHLVELLIPGMVGLVRTPAEAASMLTECLAAVPDEIARTVQEADDIWCGLWRFAATADIQGDVPGRDEDLAMEVVEDVVSLSAFEMSAFSDSAPSGHGQGSYCERSSWSATAESAAEAMADPDDIAYAIDHSIVMLSCAGMIMPPVTAHHVEAMREGSLREIGERMQYNAEAEEVIGMAVEMDVSDFRNIAVEHLMRGHGRRDPKADAVRIYDIATALSVDLEIPRSGLSLMAEIHATSDPVTWDEIARRGMSKSTVLQAAWLFLAIDAPNVEDVDATTPIGAVMTATAFTTACAALLRTDPMEMPQHHPSASMIASKWGAGAPSECSRPGIARDNLRALVRRHAAWDALTNDTRELSDLAYVVEAAMETLCLDSERRADERTDWMHYGIPLIVRRYAAEVHEVVDLAWMDVVQDSGLRGLMARSHDPLSKDTIEDLIETGRPVHHGRATITHAVVHCVDPMEDARTSSRIRAAVPWAGSVMPGRTAYERVVELDGRRVGVDDAVALADALMTACGVHGCWVTGIMDGKPFVALAGYGDGDDAYVGRSGGTRH